MKAAMTLPGQRLGPDGQTRVDYRLIVRLALPFMLNSAVQAILNATDTWFVSRLSTAATAAIGAVYWPVLVFIFLFGGVGLSVQTLVAQAHGARRFARAAQATWIALWGSLVTAPLFAVLAFGGSWLFAPFEIPSETLPLALDYWMPRMLCAPIGVALWTLLGFFNGIGRPRITLAVTVSVAAANAVLNELFMFHWSLGIAGSAWATGAAQLLGIGMAFALFLSASLRARYKTHWVGALRMRLLTAQLRLGFPMGLLYAADLFGFALFTLIQVNLSSVDGAATQIVFALTSICYMPAYGIAMAGTTLVGQAIGAGNKAWAAKVGNGIVILCVSYMGILGLLLALSGPDVLPWFVNSSDPQAATVVARATVLLWIATGYQIFDGLNISSGACLRGAGDALLPALMVIALSWLFFIPLTQALAFAPGHAWVSWLPSYGYGALGGWIAAVAYMMLLGIMLYLRWWSGAWQRIDLKFSTG